MSSPDDPAPQQEKPSPQPEHAANRPDPRLTPPADANARDDRSRSFSEGRFLGWTNTLAVSAMVVVYLLQWQAMRETNRLTLQAVRLSQDAGKQNDAAQTRALDISDRAARAAETAAHAAQESVVLAHQSNESMKRTVAVSDQTRLDTRELERAHVIVSVGWHGNPVTAQNGDLGHLELQNIGRTGAADVSVALRMRVGRDAGPVPEESPEDWRYFFVHQTLAPGESRAFGAGGMVTDDVYERFEQLRQVGAGLEFRDGRRLFVIGRVSYSDTLGNRYTIEPCFVWYHMIAWVPCTERDRAVRDSQPPPAR